jgi:hypothetical protein
MGSRAGLDEMEIIELPAGNSGCPARSQFTVLTELSSLKDLAYFPFLKRETKTVSLSPVSIFEDLIYFTYSGMDFIPLKVASGLYFVMS